MKSIKEVELKGKKVLLRIDINSEMINGKIQDNPRFEEHAQTINYLKNKKAKVVIIAHQGEGKESLEQHSKILSKYSKVKFVKDIVGRKAELEINLIKEGEAVLLENIRSLKEEFNIAGGRKNKIVKFFSSRFDYFVQDAFSICHRKQTSNIGLPKFIPSLIGLVMEKELSNLSKLKKLSGNSIYILGGVKVKDLIPILKHKNILSTGLFSLLCLMAKGKKLGKHEELIKDKINLVQEIKPYLKNISLPEDIAVEMSGIFGKKRMDVSIESLPLPYPIYDIGKKTILNYSQEIKKAKGVLFKGACGKIEDKNFEKGTKEILKSISKSKCFSVIAGGSSSMSLKKFGINKKAFDYVSLSGGALVHYLAGEKLPGVEVLKK